MIAAGSVGLDADEPLDLRLQGVVDNRWLREVVPWFELTGSTDVLATVRGTSAAPRVNGQAAVRPGARLTSAALPRRSRTSGDRSSSTRTGWWSTASPARWAAARCRRAATSSGRGRTSPSSARFQVAARGSRCAGPRAG